MRNAVGVVVRAGGALAAFVLAAVPAAALTAERVLPAAVVASDGAGHQLVRVDFPALAAGVGEGRLMAAVLNVPTGSAVGARRVTSW